MFSGVVKDISYSLRPTGLPALLDENARVAGLPSPSDSVSNIYPAVFRRSGFLSKHRCYYCAEETDEPRIIKVTYRPSQLVALCPSCDASRTSV